MRSVIPYNNKSLADAEDLVSDDALIPVVMSPLEQEIAYLVGMKRDSTAKGPDAHGLKKSKEGWRKHVVGALGEMAVGKLLNVYWHAPIGTYKDGGDLGKKIQVRTRTCREYGLIIRKADRSHDYFVLVLSDYQYPEDKKPTKNVTVYVVGWLWAEYGRDSKWWRTYGKKADGTARPGAWFVPQTVLHTDFDRLLAHIYPKRRSVPDLSRMLGVIQTFLETGPLHPENEQDDAEE